MARQLIERLFQGVEQFFLFKSVPTLSEMNELINQTNDLIDLIKTKQEVNLIAPDALDGLLVAYDKIKVQWEFDANGLVGEKNGEKWADVGRKKQGDLYWKINSIYKALRGLRSSDMCIGFITFFVLLLLLTGSMGGYLKYHPSSDAQMVDSLIMEKYLNTMRDLLIDVKVLDKNQLAKSWQEINSVHERFEEKFNESLPAEISLPSVKNDLKSLNSAIDDKNSELAIAALGRIEVFFFTQIKVDESQQRDKIIFLYTQLEQLISRLTSFDMSDKTSAEKEATEREAAWADVKGNYNQVKKGLLELPISHTTQQRLGKLLANINQKNLENSRKIVVELKVNIDSDIYNMRETFFYTTNPLKWLEIATWSWFGVLVGVIFYMSKQLKLGVFDRQDVPSILGEIFMAPIVTCVIFFLFDATGITEFSPADDSIVIVLGFAFIFGYAIRRTVGLLDNIKQRLLPSP